MIEVAWTVPDRPVSDAELVRAAEVALEVGGRPGIELSLVLVDDPTLTEMHARHLGDPGQTDVITFDLGQEGGGPAGELFVSVDRARAVARELGVPWARELLLYVVHGTLHLCGHDDRAEEDAARMRVAEREALERLGVETDPKRHGG